ncbi:Lnb N-terminal periplasmic domain-containing protein [Arsenicibacter rosenii]|uniref:Uncharacterized protein n=1 Tax=Arsenicibacter rosenii TaxID=1750698 RepID=A0A1S2VKI4_9BACT|nr:DUF4105 domain-containing protein [Arsenicibacter rosenii]OIN58735.1 hypothetical protein BLX24_14370 [Arsenicibacter rosenii]
MRTTTMNKRNWVSLLGMLLLAITLRAQPLSPSAQVSVITVAPGEALYSSFGHIILRVFDPVTGLDRPYNYGTFDFRTDNFYVKFLRGTLPYTLSVGDLYREMAYWQYENRSAREQVLNLSPAQKQRLFDALETNYRPENREYQYKFYYDNCATRPVEMLVKACGDSLRFNNAVDTTRSFRQWMNDYLGRQPWAQLGMNLALGYPSDETANAWQVMYLPNNVFAQLAKATIRMPNGQVMPLVQREQVLFQAAQTLPQELPFFMDPNVVFAILGLLLALVTVRQYKAGKVSRRIDRVLFSFIGLCGWILLLLWVATNHGVTAWNPTILYLMPFHLPLIFWVTKPQNLRFANAYFGTTAILIVLGLLLAKVPGGAHILLGLTLLIRCFVNMRLSRNRSLMRTSGQSDDLIQTT